MILESRSITDGERIPEANAFCAPDPEATVSQGGNLSPHLAWSEVPDGTHSFVVICVDVDVPTVGDDVNVEGRTVPSDLERTDFYHWVLVNVPPSVRELSEGQDSDGVTAGGKELGQTEYGIRGRNDYTAWFAGDEEMGGTYGGYDGPCPPWNDERIHRYHFRVYALDVNRLHLTGDFGGAEALEAMEGHVLETAEIVGTYALNPALL
ncbi:MAG: YbhB/YbcL family Raf kinase inhibitor-like protein [Gemmatimonadetes bacterium]|nr:YbhB/YbcL family Raf kinase inhibitor-like protein [Gemmatimonadota bacterium]NIR79457.1 YbhB/YbcL family Raf kinase inhibitor-like protein [Gemmatimonadota bacterium]NIT87321.1 YbhB/YbcL family Raf kinase inhibitor-like protein [Gemmatimonadota bacterium]NIU31165.1 YbhB/YbcL family Raf kinase inhibitor-like protein [Gemmatimonadota bacterium]NIU35891.1 YbhB/YbcL family Raf kinase inhibitor-like protein [Gemmatimonadota bacterium]